MRWIDVPVVAAWITAMRWIDVPAGCLDHGDTLDRHARRLLGSQRCAGSTCPQAAWITAMRWIDVPAGCSEHRDALDRRARSCSQRSAEVIEVP